VAAFALVAWAAAAEAVELRLRPQCTPTARLVTVADLAEIEPADGPLAEKLAEVKLFPAPVRGKKRVVRAGELMELLTLRGFDLQDIRFGGSELVSIESPRFERLAPASPAQQRLPASEIARASDEVRTAVAGFLRKQDAAEAPWAVELNLSPQQAERVLSSAEPLHIRCDDAPQAGRRTFFVSGRGPRPEEEFAVEADLWQAASVVVARRDLARGERLTAADVRLQTADRRGSRTVAVASLEDAVGKELTRGVPADQPLPADAVRSPRLVERGEIVTVYAYNSGVRVRIAARAREDGGQGDLVLIESLENRKTYYARVSGVQTVEVYAQAARARSEAAPPAPSGARPNEAGPGPTLSAESKAQGGVRG
jgi:flagella basal body P-ring formation protein FlgA